MKSPRNVVLSIMLGLLLASSAAADISASNWGTIRRYSFTLFDVAPYTFQIIPSYNNEWEDRIFFYFDTRSLHDDARVSFDAYVLLMSMPPAGMTSTLVLTAYSHGSSVMLPSDWYEATSGQSTSPIRRECRRGPPGRLERCGNPWG